MNKNFQQYLIFFITLVFLSCTTSENQVIQESKTAQERDQTENSKKKVIVFFGNSITAGFGLEISDAFTTLIQARLDSMNAGYQAFVAGDRSQRCD